jgi:hypothetical protein
MIKTRNAIQVDEQHVLLTSLLAENDAETAEHLRKLRADFDVIALVEDGDAIVDSAERSPLTLSSLISRCPAVFDKTRKLPDLEHMR